MGRARSIASQLERARLILAVASADPELAARLVPLGYDAAAIQAGQTLYEASGGQRAAVYAAHGDQLGATEAVETRRRRVEANTNTLAQIARTVFTGNVAALETLGMRRGRRAGAPAAPRTPRRNQSQAAFLDRARVLYDAALADPALVAELQQVGYPQSRLQSERAEVAALEAADVAQEQRKAEARAHAVAQQAALAQLNAWVTRFIGIVGPALRDRPDLLRQMGLKLRGRPRPA